jgi:hypothetical protein
MLPPQFAALAAGFAQPDAKAPSFPAYVDHFTSLQSFEADLPPDTMGAWSNESNLPVATSSWDTEWTAPTATSAGWNTSTSPTTFVTSCPSSAYDFGATVPSQVVNQSLTLTSSVPAVETTNVSSLYGINTTYDPRLQSGGTPFNYASSSHH